MRSFGLLWLFPTWIISRLIALAGTLSGEVPEDVVLYGKWTQTLWAGSFPVGDQAWQYPPGAALAFLLLGDAQDGLYRRFTLLALGADVLILLTLVLASRKREDSTLLGPWVWVLAGFAIGPLLLQRYDLIPTLFAVIALALLTRPTVSGVAAGFGFVIKLWPALVLLGVPRRQLLRSTLAALAVTAAVWGLMSLFFDNSFDFIRQQQGRGLEIESVAALPFMLAKALGLTVPVRGQFGSWEITLPIGQDVALGLTALTGLLLFGLLVARIVGRLDQVPPGDVVLLALLVFIVTSKVNSPQYSIWLAGVAAAALLDRRSQMLGVVALLGLMVIVTHAVIWPQFVGLMTGNPIIVAFQGLRILLLVAATVWAATNVFRRKAPAPPTEVSS